MAVKSTLGKMRQRLKIQYQTRTADGGGSENVTWTDSVTVFGFIQPQTGAERLFGDQLEERITHLITIRFRRDISHKNRLVYEFFRANKKHTRIFNVKRVINRDTADKYSDILCEEGVAT